MKRWQPFSQLIWVRILEFIREPEALFWVYGFPLILAVGLGIAFNQQKPDPPIVDVQAQPDASKTEALAERLRKAEIKAEVRSADECSERLRRGQSSLVIIQMQDKLEYHFDVTRAECREARYQVEAVLRRSQTEPADFADINASEPGHRYIDWLLPGLIGMNIMGGGLFGIGFYLVDMRVRKLFKRMMATPMRHNDFMISLFAARLLFLMPEMFSLLFLGWLMFGVPVRGSLFALALVIFVGAAAFAGLGLLLGCRTEKTETMSGLINLIMLPQYLLSGIFFSSKKFPDEAQPFIQALPLTQLNDALRAVMLDGAGLNDIAWSLGIMALWAVVTFTLALRWFRWR